MNKLKLLSPAQLHHVRTSFHALCWLIQMFCCFNVVKELCRFILFQLMMNFLQNSSFFSPKLPLKLVNEIWKSELPVQVAN